MNPEELNDVAIMRTEKMLNTVDSTILRAWHDGYKYALHERGLLTAPAPVPQQAPFTPPSTPAPATFGSNAPPTPEPSALFEIPTAALHPNWRKVYHARGEYPCGKPALILIRAVYADERGSLSLLRYINGEPISPDHPAICGSCRKPIHVMSNSDLDWAAHLLPARGNYDLSFAEQATGPAQGTPTQEIPPEAPSASGNQHPARTLASMHGLAHSEYTGEDADVSIMPDERESIARLQEELGLQFGEASQGEPSHESQAS